ncbi:UDP-glucose dehydrogenase family protein [Fodinibius saliphilus]|uniref:UDP-glucose dehydrogenase family protein n=1 Tax=Fodinibius saliphilus TaxID=1920650 RepID=UPI0011091E5B|nr:UDP-glucose/GDP-mannose dehydrogenase family protein [Fodinibius saliphilus]
MNISVIGTGYVGLVSGVCLSEKGHNVTCVDIDKEKVKKINSGIPPIYEKRLKELLNNNIKNGFSATTDLHSAILHSDLSIIAVGTPYRGDKIDLSSIKKAASAIGVSLKEKEEYHVVVVKSTVVPGTTDDVVQPILEETSGKKAGKDFGVGMNPEFLREGEAIDDFMNPDRIVLGGIDPKTHSILKEVYKVFEGVDILTTNNKTAEMIKYTANSLLATLISFSNEIGNLCATLGGIDAVEVMEGVHKDKRFSPILANGNRITPGFLSYLAAGCGFGGSCFPKDVKALIAHGKDAGNPMALLDSVIEINKKQPQEVIALLRKHLSSLRGKTIGVLGLAFKPGTDDMRESPAIPIVNYLLTEGAKIKAYDPEAQHEAKKLFGNHQIVYQNNLSQSIQGTDAILLLTSWDEFKQVPDLIHTQNEQPLIIDGRRMLSKNLFHKYEGIGLSL